MEIKDEHLIKIYHLYSAETGYDYTQDFRDSLTMARMWKEKEGLNWINNILNYKSCFNFLKVKGYLKNGNIQMP